MDRKDFVLSYPHGCRDVNHKPAIEQLIKNRVLRDKSWGGFWLETNKKTKCRALKDALLYLVRVCDRFGSAKLVSGCSQERLL